MKNNGKKTQNCCKAFHLRLLFRSPRSFSTYRSPHGLAQIVLRPTANEITSHHTNTCIDAGFQVLISGLHFHAFVFLQGPGYKVEYEQKGRRRLGTVGAPPDADDPFGWPGDGAWTLRACGCSAEGVAHPAEPGTFS